MLKRVLSLFLSIVMVLSAVPFQVFAEEIAEEATEAVQIEAVETLAEETLPEETEAAEETEAPAEEPEVVEPEVTEPEVVEPEVTEPEVVEPEVSEPEESQPEETEAKEEIPALPRIPATRVEIRPETLTKTEDVRIVEVDENGNFRYHDTTETTSTTYMVAETVRNYPADAKTIYGSDDWFSFETFEDLKQLCAGSYADYTNFSYDGEGPLVISEDLTLPANVHLSAWSGTIIINEGVTFSTANYDSSVYADTLIVNGTFVNRGWSNIEGLLEVNGTMKLYSSMGLGENATISGVENVLFMYDYAYLEKQFYTNTFADFLAALAAAKKETSGIVYYISWYPAWDAENKDLVLEESVTIPANVSVSLGEYDEGTFTIAKGVTLEINSERYSSLNGNVTVHGKLVNNADQLSVDGTLTFSSTGKYSGNGKLNHYTDDPNEKLEDWLSGLDLSNMEITEDRYPEYDSYSWTLRNVTGMPKLGTPKNLQWNKEYTWVYNEKKDTWEEKLVDHKGIMTWVPVEPDQGFADVTIYKEGEDWSGGGGWRFGSYGDLPPYRSVENFVWGDYDSGTYYFTVQSMADGNNYRNSDVATSGTWTYTRPNKSLGTATNLTWNWPEAHWTTADGASLECEVEFLYAPTANAEPYVVSGTWGPTSEWGAQVWDEIIQENGTGYYYFRVRPLSDDITKICNGTWSELSPAYNLDKTVENVKGQLDSISTKADDEIIRDTVQSLDTEELKSAMLADKGTEGVMDQLEKLENAVGGAAPVQVNDAAFAFDASKISIVGANLNDAAYESKDPITLVVDKPQEEHILDAAYDNAVAVSFSMTLENAADAENLEVPVKITLPVPADINPDFLVILHYKQNGEIEELTLGDVHVYKQGKDTYASFVLTSFSDFVMTNYADNAIASGETGDLYWEVTGWGKLVLSGEGVTDYYYEDYRAPWTEYADRITEVIIEPGVTEIGMWVFYDLDQITELVIPDGVEFIYEQAICDCDKLQTIWIPSSASVHMAGIAANCHSLQYIYVADDHDYLRDSDGILYYDYNNGEYLEIYTYPEGRPESVYDVENGTDTIGTCAFRDAKNLEEVKLPEGLTCISNNAFDSSSIETITIPASVIDIGYYAFADCSDLQTIYFQGDPMPIADNAFTGVEADAYYPADNEYWTEDFMLGYGGNLNWMPSDYVEVTGSAEVEGGKSVKLTAKILPENTAGNKIKWALAEGDEEFASLKVSGNTATITAVDVSELHTITVIASSAEGIAPCQYELAIIPKAKAMDLYFWYEDIEADEAYWYYLNPENQWSWILEEGDENGYVLAKMWADVLPFGANAEVTWTSSNPDVATIETVYEDGCYYGIAYGTGKTGSVTLTATAKNGIKASYTWKIIDLDIDAEPVGETELSLMGGQSTTLKIRNAETKKSISSKNVVWYLWTTDGSDASAYATISTSGKLTTKKVNEAVTIYACADVHKDYFLSDYVEYKIDLYPATTHLELKYQLNKYNGETLPFDVTSKEPISITAELLPEDVMDVPVKWEINDNPKAKWVTDEETGLLSKTGKYATYTINEETNELQISNPTGNAGTVTVKATAQDGSKKSATVKVQFAVYAKKVEILNEETELISGKSLTLKAEVGPENVTKKGVTWFLGDPADKAYVTLSGSKLTAKTVYEEKTVRLVAESKDGSIGAYYDITIKPKADALAIYEYYSEENVTKGTIYSDLSEKDRDVILVAKNASDGSEADVTWNWKPTKVADIYELDDGRLQVFMLTKGSVTITAKQGKRTTTVTIKAAYQGWYVDITAKNDKNIVQDIYGQDVIAVASGKSVELKATVKDRNERTNGVSQKVTWSIPVGGQYATISSSGKVTAAKDLTTVQYVSVRATAADGSGAVIEETVMINPLATGIKIYTLEEDMEQRTINAYSNGWMNNRSNTNLIWDMAAVDENGETNDSFQIYSTVYPYYGERDSRNAMQAVTWKSSSPKIASVDAEGKVTCLKPGTTTITCTAADGSGQKISFKLTVVKRMTGLQLNNVEVAGGKSVTLKPIIEPADTTNKKLYWGIYGDTAFAKIDQKGKLTTKKVTSVKTVYVYVWSEDGSQLFAECEVKIYPKAVSDIELWYGGEEVTGKTVTLTERTITWMELVMEPAGKCSTNVTWKSSDPESVSVDENGIITAFKATKKPVTITCTATDGSNKKVTVKIKVVK